MEHKRLRSDDETDTLFSSSPVKRPRRDSCFSMASSSQYTPYPPEPLDSPSNPFGRKHTRSKIHKLPPVTMFGKHVPLRFQLVRKGLGPRLGGVHRVVQVPLNYSFTHLRGLIAFLFDSNVRYHGRRGLSGPFGIPDEYLFEVVHKLAMFSPLYKPGQIRSSTTKVKLSNVRDPCRWRAASGLESDEDDELDDEDELEDGDEAGGADQDMHDPSEASGANGDLEEKPGEWRWDDEENYTLGHVWPKGLDVERGIIYHHSRTTQVHITINSLTELPTRTGKSNEPHVFVARGRVHLSPPPLPPPKFTTSPDKSALFASKPKSPRTKPNYERAESVELDDNLFIQNTDEEDDDEGALSTASSSHREDPSISIDVEKWNVPEGKFGSYFLEFMGCPADQDATGSSVEKEVKDPFEDDDGEDEVGEKPKKSPFPNPAAFGEIEADSEEEDAEEEGDQQDEEEEDSEEEEENEDQSQEESEEEEEWEDDIRSHPTSSPVRHISASPSPAKEHNHRSETDINALPSSSPPSYPLDIDLASSRSTSPLHYHPPGLTYSESTSPSASAPESVGCPLSAKQKQKRKRELDDEGEDEDDDGHPAGPLMSSSPAKPHTDAATTTMSPRRGGPRSRIAASSPAVPLPSLLAPSSCGSSKSSLPSKPTLPGLAHRTAFSSPGPLPANFSSLSLPSSPTRPSLADIHATFVLSNHYPNPKHLNSETPMPRMSKAQRMRIKRMERRISFSAGDGWKRLEEAEEREEKALREKRQKMEEALRKAAEKKDEDETGSGDEDGDGDEDETKENNHGEEEDPDVFKTLDQKRKSMAKLYEISKQEFQRGIIVGKKVWKRRFEKVGLEYPGWGLDNDDDDGEEEEDELVDDDDENENEEDEEEEEGRDDEEEDDSDAQSVDL